MIEPWQRRKRAEKGNISQARTFYSKTGKWGDMRSISKRSIGDGFGIFKPETGEGTLVDNFILKHFSVERLRVKHMRWHFYKNRNFRPGYRPDSRNIE